MRQRRTRTAKYQSEKTGERPTLNCQFITHGLLHFVKNGPLRRDLLKRSRLGSSVIKMMASRLKVQV